MLFFYTRVLFHGLGRYGGGRLRAVAYLRIRCRGRNRPPRLATGHADRDATDQ